MPYADYKNIAVELPYSRRNFHQTTHYLTVDRIPDECCGSKDVLTGHMEDLFDFECTSGFPSVDNINVSLGLDNCVCL